MKKFLCILLLICSGFVSFSQQPVMSFEVIRKVHNTESDVMLSLLVKGDPGMIRELTIESGGIYKYYAGNISSLILPASSVETFAANAAVQRIEDGAPLLQPLQDDTMRYMNKIVDVHLGTAPLPQPYTGKNVILGIIDTGIDFNHQDFKDSTGATRIKYIWDHLLPDSLNTPLPYNYGQEFTASDIDNGFASAHHDQGVHGTVITGIAAGNGSAVNMFTGAAPDAELIVVSVNFNQSDAQFLSSVADAVDYIYNKADQEGKPCVINISAGTYFGSHDGKDLSTQLIDNLISQQNGRSLVCAAGNAGNYPIHVQTTVTTGDTSFTWFKNAATQSYCEFWGDSIDMNNIEFTIAADKTSPAYEFRGELPYTNIQQQLGILHQDTLYSSDGNRLAIVTSYADKTGDQYGMYYLVQHDSAYNWRLQTTGNGTVDAYSFDWITSVPSPAVYPPVSDYIFPDLTQNMCSGFQCSDKAITVGQYTNMNQYTDYTGTLQTFPLTVGAIHPTSSIGPTRDGRIKPDLAASGEWTFGPLIVSSQPWFIANQPFKIPPTAQHLRGNGTSAASAVVSGIAALYLERFPAANWLAVKNALINCSDTDIYTGNLLPDNTWGYGKVNAFNAITNCGLTGISGLPAKEYIYLTPNPFTSLFTVHVNNHDEACRISVTDALGKAVADEYLPEGADHFEFHTPTRLKPGCYFVKLFSGNRLLSTAKIIKAE